MDLRYRSLVRNSFLLTIEGRAYIRREQARAGICPYSKEEVERAVAFLGAVTRYPNSHTQLVSSLAKLLEANGWNNYMKAFTTDRVLSYHTIEVGFSKALGVRYCADKFHNITYVIDEDGLICRFTRVWNHNDFYALIRRLSIWAQRRARWHGKE